MSRRSQGRRATATQQRNSGQSPRFVPHDRSATMMHDFGKLTLKERHEAVLAECASLRARLARAEADTALRELAGQHGEHAPACPYWRHDPCACYLAPAYTDHPGAALQAAP